MTETSKNMFIMTQMDNVFLYIYRKRLKLHQNQNNDEEKYIDDMSSTMSIDEIGDNDNNFNRSKGNMEQEIKRYYFNDYLGNLIYDSADCYLSTLKKTIEEQQMELLLLDEYSKGERIIHGIAIKNKDISYNYNYETIKRVIREYVMDENNVRKIPIIELDQLDNALMFINLHNIDHQADFFCRNILNIYISHHQIAVKLLENILKYTNIVKGFSQLKTNISDILNSLESVINYVEKCNKRKIYFLKKNDVFMKSEILKIRENHTLLKKENDNIKYGLTMICKNMLIEISHKKKIEEIGKNNFLNKLGEQKPYNCENNADFKNKPNFLNEKYNHKDLNTSKNDTGHTHITHKCTTISDQNLHDQTDLEMAKLMDEKDMDVFEVLDDSDFIENSSYIGDAIDELSSADIVSMLLEEEEMILIDEKLEMIEYSDNEIRCIRFLESIVEMLSANNTKIINKLDIKKFLYLPSIMKFIDQSKNKFSNNQLYTILFFDTYIREKIICSISNFLQINDRKIATNAMKKECLVISKLCKLFNNINTVKEHLVKIRFKNELLMLSCYQEEIEKHLELTKCLKRVYSLQKYKLNLVYWVITTKTLFLDEYSLIDITNQKKALETFRLIFFEVNHLKFITPNLELSEPDSTNITKISEIIMDLSFQCHESLNTIYNYQKQHNLRTFPCINAYLKKLKIMTENQVAAIELYTSLLRNNILMKIEFAVINIRKRLENIQDDLGIDVADSGLYCLKRHPQEKIQNLINECIKILKQKTIKIMTDLKDLYKVEMTIYYNEIRIDDLRKIKKDD